MSETDLPVLAALAEVAAPPADSAGARFLRDAFAGGRSAVPEDDAQVWATWVDLVLWRSTGPVAQGVHLTDHARGDLAALADRLGETPETPVRPVPAQSPGGRTGLTGEQDARLRTLAVLRELGELSPELQELRRAYRERDQRAVVRPPAPVAWPARSRGGDRA